MNLLLTVLIVAAAGTAPTEQRYPDARAVYECAFEQASDQDFDGWPDGWQRKRDPHFPHYLPIRVVAGEAYEGKSSLRMALDGGAATIFSPAQPIRSDANFVLEVAIKTEGLKVDSAFASLTFLDAQGQILDSAQSTSVGGSTPWKIVRLGPVGSASKSATHVVIGLHLQPAELTDSQADLTGTAWFDGLWLGQTPRISLGVLNARPLHKVGEPVAIAAHLTACPSRPKVAIEVRDSSDQRVAELEKLLPADNPKDQGQDESWAKQWEMRFPAPGLYRIRLVWTGEGGFEHMLESPVTVIETWPRTTGGEFGLALPELLEPATQAQYLRLLEDGGVHWVKFPPWILPGDTQDLERRVALVEELRRRDIRIVGLLADPPAAVRKQMGLRAPVSAAELYGREPSSWMPAIEPLLTRFGLQIRTWQLGSATDPSLSVDKEGPTKVARVDREFSRFISGFELALPSGCDLPRMTTRKLPWQILSVSGTKPGGDDALDSLNDRKPGEPQRWVALRPLDPKKHNRDERGADLIRQMLEAKLRGANGVEVADPVGDRSALLQDDGTPGELYLPWRTASCALSGTKYAGSITFPQGASNHVFIQKSEAVVVAWSRRSRREVMYLGPEARQLDQWGRSRRLGEGGGPQTLDLGPEPVFIVGASPELMRFRLGLSLAQTRFESIFGVTHQNKVIMTNTFARPVSGSLRVIPPDGWRARPERIELQLAAGQRSELPVELVVPLSGTTGPQMIRFDFELTGDGRREFSAFQPIELGQSAVRIEINSELNGKGQLEVHQRLINETDRPVSFNSNLYAPGLVRIRRATINLGRGDDTKVYYLPDGARLLGQTLWVRAEEIGGSRVLSYRFVAGRP